jgi:hypothetical protein
VADDRYHVREVVQYEVYETLYDGDEEVGDSIHFRGAKEDAEQIALDMNTNNRAIIEGSNVIGAQGQVSLADGGNGEDRPQ